MDPRGSVIRGLPNAQRSRVNSRRLGTRRILHQEPLSLVQTMKWMHRKSDVAT